MLSPLRNRFGIPGVISVIALVFAMFGGAYAATNSSEGGKATASAKAKKGPRGPKGPKGDAGPVGPAGPAGPAGAKGDKGDTGNAGVAGKSVTTNALGPGEGPIGEECEEGGVELVSASGVSVVCNGEEGSPWTAGGKLPPGATETGVWGIPGASPAGGYALPISFTLPLATAPEAIFLKEGELSAPGCPGQVGGVPKAEPGKLCVYADVFEEVASKAFFKTVPGLEEFGVSATGTRLKIQCEPFCTAAGTWAVTG